MYESKDVMVSHPKHYQTEGGLEVIDIIQSIVAGLDGASAYYVGNIIKYISRYRKKNGVQDLEKAQWYLTHLIEHEKALNE